MAQQQQAGLDLKPREIGKAVPSEQCQEVLVLVIRHLCTLGGERQREADRLSVALQRRMTDWRKPAPARTPATQASTDRALKP
jgi:hypothetical protein